MALAGNYQTNCLAELERRLPGVDMYNFGLRQSTPQHFVAQFSSEVTRYQPDLVLVFLSVGRDIAPQAHGRSEYDWRSVRIVQCGSRLLDVHPPGRTNVDPAEDSSDYEDYVRQAGRHLAVCRTPIDAAMQVRWREATDHLDQLATRCRRQGIALGLVLVPGEFQVCPSLCQAASRRMGYETSQLDLELPQRRLSRFAQQRDLPVIDLLPYFRACGSSMYSRQHGDLNDRGNEIATQVIGAWLSTRYGTQITTLTQTSLE